MQPQTFGHVIRARRNELGLTRAEFALAGGPSYPTLSAIENGFARRLAAGTFTALDAGCKWELGTSRRMYLESAALAQQTRNAGASLAQLLRTYRELERLDATPEVIEDAATLLGDALRPHMQHLIANLSVTELITTYLKVQKVVDDPVLADRITQKRRTTPSGMARSLRTHRRRRQAPYVPVPDGPPISMREFRTVRKGWTLQQLSTHLTAQRQSRDPSAVRVTAGTLSAIETGQRGMSAAMAADLEQVYELRAGALVTQCRPRGVHRT